MVLLGQMDITDEDLIRAVREIASCPLPQAARRKRYIEIAEAFPSLFDMACEGRVDEGTLKLMLRMRKRVSMNKMTGDDADTAVGVTLAKRFVEPTLGSLQTPGSSGPGPGPGAETTTSDQATKRTRTT